jgi:hypothetical protein
MISRYSTDAAMCVQSQKASMLKVITLTKGNSQYFSFNRISPIISAQDLKILPQDECYNGFIEQKTFQCL